MPAIRDYAYNYISSAGTTIVVPMPAYVQNDLLVAIMSSDGPQTSTSVTATGWTQVGYWDQSGTNACSVNILAKYAGASESDTTFTMSTETLNGMIISIQDVYQDADVLNAFDVKTTSYSNSTSYTSLRQAFASLNTTVADCLVLYTVINNAVSVPSILEGPVSTIIGKDGSAHADGVAWTIQRAAGATPSNVYATCIGTATPAGHKVTITIKPPSGGATIIPAYCASDSSVYISPMTGAAFTSAAGANTATGALDTTYFSGASLNGKTLAVSGTTYTQADTGINTYHASKRIIGLATSGTWAGNSTTMASINLSGKNLLFHISPYLPVDIQTTDSVALTGTCGIAVGFASSASNWKAWHLHGAGTPWGTNYWVPCVIHSGNTSGVIQTTGTVDMTVVVRIGFFVSGKVVAPDWLMCSVWALDTTIIAGGNATYPITIPDIIAVAADGKERRSVVQQGASQALVLQPLQIGDGGTNVTYMSLDSTAIEFPRQYDKANKQVNYCSTDNVAGLKYYPGSSDTIIHKNSVISSSSRYHWGLHASASTSATYNFSGLSVIGAGTITLGRAITISGLTINDYSTLDVSGLTLTGSTILNMPATNDSMTTSASTAISSSTITTTTVTAGNRWCSVASPVIFASNTFTGSSTTGHAMRITSTTGSPFTFVGNTFTSYGPTVFGFHTTNDVTGSSSDWVTKADHGYTDGDPVIYMKQGGSVAMGLTDTSTYYVNAITSSTLSFYDTYVNAIAGGTTGRVDLTATGSETHYINSLGAAIFNDSAGAIVLNITSGGNAPTIRNGASASTTVNLIAAITITVKDQAGTVIPGVEVAIFQDNSARTVVLASTTTGAAGTVTTTTTQSLGAIIIRARQSTETASFLTSESTSNGIESSTEQINFSSNHNFQTGDAVVYSRNGGSVDIGPEPGTFYINAVDVNTVMLYDTAANAITGGATGKQGLTASGAEAHLLNPVRYVPGSATGTIGTSDFTLTITLITDSIATG